MTANVYSGIRGALIQGLEASTLSLPVAVDNAPFDKPADQGPWASAFIEFNQPSPATMGDEGEDAHDGILQVDLNYPLLSGDAGVTTSADLLADFFKAGKRLTYQGVEVTVSSCGRSRGREVDGWYRVSMTVVWFARIPRN